MKLFLPKLLLVAVMATFADAQDVNQSPTVITEAGYYWGNSLVLEGDVVMQGVTDPAAYDGAAIIWNTETGEASMSGRGKLSSQSSGEYWSLQIGGGSEVCRIGSEVELESVDISFDGNFASSILCIDGNLSDFEICGYAESVIDLSKAKLSGKQEYDIDAGNTLVINELEVKEGVFVEVSGYGAEGYATLQGNLVMNGVLPAFAGEERFEYRSVDWEERMQPYGAVQFWVSHEEGMEPEPFVPLSVSGTITIKSGTAVVFANEGDFIIGEDNRVSWKSDYRLPTTTDVLFVCSGVDEDSLSLLKPYAYCEDSWAEYSDGGEVTGGYEYIKPVDDREFYAKAGEDGRVHIYLGDVSNDSEGDTPIEPSVPALGSVVLTPFVQDAIRGKNIVLEGDCTIPDNLYINWVGTDVSASYEMTGNGTVSTWLFQICSESDTATTYTIGNGISFDGVELAFDANSQSLLKMNGTLKDSTLHVWKGTADISNATVTGSTCYQISRGAAIACNTLTVKQDIALRNYDGYPESAASAYATIKGNLELNGVLSMTTTEQQSEYDAGGWVSGLHSGGYVQFWTGTETISPLNVMGAISIKSDTAIVFSNEGEYRLPGTDDAVFICSSVDQDSLSMLQAYAHRQEYSDYAYTKLVTDREFYAQTGSDGKVYIYLGEATGDSGEDAPSVPSVPVTGSVVLNDLTLADADDYGSFAIRGRNIELKGNWTPPYSREDGELVSIDWISEDASTSHTLSGSGTLGCNGSIVELDICGPGQFTISKDITIANSEISLDESETGGKDTVLSVEGTLHNANVYVGRGVLKLDNATLSGYQFYELEPGSVVQRAELNLSAKRSGLSVYDYDWANTNANPKIVGNLVLDGQGSYFGNTEKIWTGESEDLIVGSHEFNPVVIFEKDSAVDGKYTTLEITGSLTIKSETAVLFGVWEDKSYSIPEKDDCLIICSSVNEGGLKLLAPYAQRGDFDYTTNEYTGYTRPLEEHEFFAQSGSDGRVYIYLGEKTNGGEPDVPVLPDFTVKPGSSIVLGGNGGQLPSVQNPVQMQGGVADASGLDESLLNNKVITGENGTLQTGHNQTMQLTGSDKIGYSVVGLAGSQHGADLEISSTSNLTLAGEKYDSARVKVQKGTVTISSKTTIGTGADGDVLDLTSKAVSATNFGTVAADVEIANESTLLNQGNVKGDVSVLGKASAMVNNGSVDGLVTVGSGALLSGSGTAGALILESGATLNVGNSPGYQKYGSLTLNRASAVSFTVDGVQSATLSNAGSGTHSVLTTDELTITPGTGSVTINVEVTMGIVNAGFEPVEVTLASAGEGNAIAADFAINLDDNELLEDGAKVTWDAATQSLILSGSVSKAALAALMDSNSANVANTMWASANAVQEMARTAEHQFLVGMPGQTTFWGAAMGSFMDISGKQGFTCNLGGYAVGLQHAFTERFRAGFALGQSFGSFKSDDDQLKADQTALMPVLTAQYVSPLDKTSSLTVSGYVAYGTVANEADTYQAGTIGKAEWDDQVLNIGVRAAWNKQVTDDSSIGVFAGVTYQNVEQDSFTEKYTGGERDYRSGSMRSLSLPLGVTWRGVYQMEGTNIFVPEVTVAYIGDIVRENPEVKTSVYGFNRVGKGTNIGRNAFMLNAGANWMFDSSWSLGAFYTLEARSNQVNQSVNAALRYSF